MLALVLGIRGIGPRRLLRPRGFGHHGLGASHPWIILIVIAILVIAYVVYRRRRR